MNKLIKLTLLIFAGCALIPGCGSSGRTRKLKSMATKYVKEKYGIRAKAGRVSNDGISWLTPIWEKSKAGIVEMKYDGREFYVHADLELGVDQCTDNYLEDEFCDRIVSYFQDIRCDEKDFVVAYTEGDYKHLVGKDVKTFDDLILENITENHILPDMINGLVLIDHVNQHLEEGIGLRQIIDWMMFVDKCLKNDTDWYRFKELAEKTGLMTLSVTTTRMCEIYLGLSEHEWCSHSDEKLCRSLMDYVMKSGNFGNKKEKTEKLAIERMGRLRHPFEAVKELQKLGRENWKLGNKPVLRRFAWMWQGIHFLKETPQYKEGYKEAKRLSAMFDALGVKRIEDGLVYYIDGEYVRK